MISPHAKHSCVPQSQTLRRGIEFSAKILRGINGTRVKALLVGECENEFWAHTRALNTDFDSS